jgi:hypothetical protein
VSPAIAAPGEKKTFTMDDAKKREHEKQEKDLEKLLME